MKRSTNRWLSCDGDDVDYRIRNEAYGRRFASPHEMYAVLREELDEFWDSVKADDPDPGELLQICAVARSALLQLCAQAREEVGWAGRGKVRPLNGEGGTRMKCSVCGREMVEQDTNHSAFFLFPNVIRVIACPMTNARDVGCHSVTVTRLKKEGRDGSD